MNTLTLSQEEIALRAYHLFLENGCQHGRDVEYWLQAEKELGAKFFTAPASATKAAPAAAKAAPAAKKAAAKKAPAPAPAAKKAPAKKPAKKKAAE